MLYGMWNVSSMTRDLTLASSSGSVVSTTRLPGVFSFNILLLIDGCTGSLLLHMSYSLVAVHKLLMAVASLAEEHGCWALGHAGFSSCGALI